MKSRIRKFIIFDRDGTLINLVPYVSKLSDVIFEKTFDKSMQLLSSTDYSFAIISNQSAIGRGLASLSEVIAINEYIARRAKIYGVEFLSILFCPHHPESLGKCRKPEIGMFQELCNRHKVDVESSYYIGDQDSDFLFAQNSNLNFVPLGNGFTNRSMSELRKHSDLYSAIESIIRNER